MQIMQIRGSGDFKSIARVVWMRLDWHFLHANLWNSRVKFLGQTPLKPQGNPFGSGQGGPIDPWLLLGVEAAWASPSNFANSKDCLSYYFAWLVGSQVFDMSGILSFCVLKPSLACLALQVDHPKEQASIEKAAGLGRYQPFNPFVARQPCWSTAVPQHRSWI